MSDLGRNDPCWCGSGKKYKKCHYGQKRPSERSKPLKLFPRRSSAPVLNEEERDGIRAAGRFNAQVLDHVRPHVGPGVKTEELDRIVHEYTLDHGHTPACLGYKGYTKSICTSINEVICHGIPDSTVLQEGDIVNVDLTTIVDGWHGDQSETFLIGEVSEEARRLVQVTFDSLYAAIDALAPGCTAYTIGHVIQKLAKEAGLGVVRDYQGHGIGRNFHQDPTILHYAADFLKEIPLEAGMCFTIEPMLNLGTHKTVLDAQDGWTVRTKDGSLSAQFEHTILLTEEGPEVLTWTQDGPKPGHRF